jgi:hypothetical protein
MRFAPLTKLTAAFFSVSLAAHGQTQPYHSSWYGDIGETLGELPKAIIHPALIPP